MARAFSIRPWLLTMAALLLFASAASAVTIDWVTVGGAGNAGDTAVMCCGENSAGTTGYGAVPYEYRIGKYEVTNAQYTEYLNAVAATDANAVYNTGMGSGITRSGTAGSYTYSTITGREDKPVNFVDFHDTLRFSNWMHNGQPTGAQGNATTEDGAYAITAQGIAGNSIMRNAGATVFLTSEDEWYKAAYYDVASMSYFDFPAGSDTPIVCTAPSATPNTANCDSAVRDLTDVGSYTGSASPNGTFDQLGNVMEWNEATLNHLFANRGLLGGGYNVSEEFYAKTFRNNAAPFAKSQVTGFRLASVIPEPTAALLFGTGFGVVGLASRKVRG